MKIIGLEEHFATPEIMAAWKALTPELQDIAVKQSSIGDIERRLLDFTDERIRSMDEAGIAMQVLSLTTPGVQSLDPEQAVPLARASNDFLAEIVRGRPDRFQGLATLATPAPGEAMRELERAIRELGLNGAILYGRTRDRNLDHPDFLPIFEAAAAMRVPLYLHPQSPPQYAKPIIAVSVTGWTLCSQPPGSAGTTKPAFRRYVLCCLACSTGFPTSR